MSSGFVATPGVFMALVFAALLSKTAVAFAADPYVPSIVEAPGNLNYP
jgi:hypothetical protein